MTEAKTVAAKLRILPGTPVWVSDMGRMALLGPLPFGAALVTALTGAKVAVVIADDADAVRGALSRHAGALASVGAFWVAYPKGNRSDINRDKLWPILGEHGFRPVSQVALDDTWSALRFRPMLPGEAPFVGGA
jgi:hypothetical protein